MPWFAWIRKVEYNALDDVRLGAWLADDEFYPSRAQHMERTDSDYFTDNGRMLTIEEGLAMLADRADLDQLVADGDITQGQSDLVLDFIYRFNVAY